MLLFPLCYCFGVVTDGTRAKGYLRRSRTETLVRKIEHCVRDLQILWDAAIANQIPWSNVKSYDDVMEYCPAQRKRKMEQGTLDSDSERRW
ncbi:hypothetical protein Tco_0998664 [Tanacetum coccineum]